MLMLAEIGVAFDRGVEIVDVGRVVLVVVNLHRLRVDVRLERVIGVGQRGKLKGHVDQSFLSGESCLHPAHIAWWTITNVV